MRVFGLEEEIAGAPVRDDNECERFEVWPENRTTVEVFIALQHQWYVVDSWGALIRTGINYASIPIVLSMRPDIHRKQWPEIFKGIRVMESAALETMHELKEKQAT